MAAIKTSSLGLQPDSYIYRIISTAARSDPLTYERVEQLAIISSDDSLRLLSPETLQVLPDGVIPRVNDKVTCLERGNDAASSVVATAGRDGTVKLWDTRSKKSASSIQSRQSLSRYLYHDIHTNHTQRTN